MRIWMLILSLATVSVSCAVLGSEDASPITIRIAQASLVENPMKRGPRRVPGYVVDECKRYFVNIGRDDENAQSECLAKMGFPADPNYVIDESPQACDVMACSEFPVPEWSYLTKSIEGAELRVWYRTRFTLAPLGQLSGKPKFKVTAIGEVNLAHIQANLPYFIATAMPRNTCEANTKAIGSSNSIQTGAYQFTTQMQTDIRACVDVPCVPNVWDTCTAITDLGDFASEVNVTISAQVSTSDLVVHADVNYRPGSKPAAVEALRRVEDFGNAITGNFLRMGLAKKFDEAIASAIKTAVDLSQDVIRERVTVPGMAAFKVKVERAELDLTPGNQLVLTITASGEIPYAAVCDVEKELASINKFVCGGR